MEILGHTIKNDEIIGISPMYQENAKDLTMVQLYGAYYLLFNIHCKQRDIEIKSNVIYNSDAYKDDKKHLVAKAREEFSDQYKKIKEQITELIKF